jgi:hypothetical protein
MMKSSQGKKQRVEEEEEESSGISKAVDVPH